MRGLERRIAALESQETATRAIAGIAEERKLVQESEAVIKRLTLEELKWMLEPAHEVQRLVPCIRHVNRIDCACRSEERRGLGLERFSEHLEEYLRHRDELLSRRDEILSRPPHEFPGARVWVRREATSPPSY